MMMNEEEEPGGGVTRRSGTVTRSRKMFELIRRVHSELEGFQTQGRDAADRISSPVSTCNAKDLRVVNGGKTTVCADGNAAGRWDRPVFHVDEPIESQSGSINSYCILTMKYPIVVNV
jgi:hypothetical protein